MFSNEIEWRSLENRSKIFFESLEAIRYEGDAWRVRILDQENRAFTFDAKKHGIVIEPTGGEFFTVVACDRFCPSHCTLAVYQDQTTAQFAAESLIRAGRAGEKIFVMPRGNVGILELADELSKYLYHEEDGEIQNTNEQSAADVPF